MILAHFFAPAVLAGLRGTYRSAGNVLLLPELVSEESAAELRALALAMGLRDHDLPDRGHYRFADAAGVPLLEELRALAEAIGGEPLALGPARFLRFVPGDYSLLQDSSGLAARTLEATLDLSPALCDHAEVNYLRGAETFAALPHVLRSLALVERTPETLRHERYLAHTRGPADVWRLRATLHPAPH